MTRNDRRVATLAEVANSHAPSALAALTKGGLAAATRSLAVEYGSRGIRVNAVSPAAGIVLGPAVLDLVKPDQAVRLVSTIGLAFLLFLAGLEIDVRRFRGPRARLTGLALGLSALLALIIGIVLHAAGLVESPLLVGIFLLATSLGLILPILEDAGVADRPVGQFAIAGASLGELTPVVLLSLFFSGRTTAIGSKLLLLSLLGVLVVLVVIGTLRIERSMWITRMINRLADTSAQIRVRLSMLLVVGLGAVATHLGFEAILGAFIAGAILRLVDTDAEHKHPLFRPKLIVSSRERAGKPIAGLDALIAAVCRSQGAALATRNVSGFDGTGIEIIDPWLQ